MKKLMIILVTGVCMLSFSQNPLAKGQMDLNAGLGLSVWGVPVYVGLDYGIHKDVTIGGELSYRSHTHYWHGNKNHPSAYYRHSMLGVMFNGNYHFNSLLNIPREWDFYAGASLGLIFGFYNDYHDYYDYYDGPAYHNRGTALGLGLQVGGRYFFTEKFGVNLELGGGSAVSGGKLGITLKF